MSRESKAKLENQIKAGLPGGGNTAILSSSPLKAGDFYLLQITNLVQIYK